jgi:serine/threonine protein kinase/Tol biopolymer transport system component
MSISPGVRLGPYEIVAAIGAGGMGEVYRARDTRLERMVAVKVLPDHLSSSEELRQRFEREAKTISQLSHPHICALYDVGEADVEAKGERRTANGVAKEPDIADSNALRPSPVAVRRVMYLVMELLEGETLAHRLLRGPLPLEQTLRYGIEIADALDRAHRSGIVHRDLKPGNVMLTKTGVKLLDFGLAKLQAAGATATSGLTSLPTVTPESQPLTSRGTILGTFQYMAPEQLEGSEADARSDIFAFGCVLYEMATGSKAFSGKSQASLIGAIMHSEPPPISLLQPMTPPALDRVVKTCLAKDADERFQTAHDVRLQLQWITEGGSAAGLLPPPVARRKSRERFAWAVAGAAMAAAALSVGYLRRAPEKPRAVRFEIATPEGVSIIDFPRVSPDGRALAFNATDSSGRSRLWLRPFNALAAQPLAGTEGTTRPFWSPDSRFLGFFADGKLKKIEVTGGPPQKICDAASGADGSWSSEGVILFDGRPQDPIYRVAAAGGTPAIAMVAEAGRKESLVAWPEFLPDGRHFLYMAQGQRPEDHMYRVGSLDSKESKRLGAAQSLVTYAPPGHILFVRENTLVAQPFDAKALKTTGEPVPLAEHIGTVSTGLARFSVSRNGVLVYRTGESASRLLWVDRSGRELSTIGDPADYSDTLLSPTADRLALVLTDPRVGKADIWIRDLAREVSSRFTFDSGDDVSPLWSPDGKTIVFSSNRGGQFDLFAKSVGGGGQEEVLVRNDELKFAHSWSRDGRYIAFQSRGKKTGWDIWILPTFGDRKPTLFLQTSFNELRPAFSPDGRWIAYQSNESGRGEIYVQAFPGPGGKWQVSSAGGVEPAWRADGKEIYYGAPEQKLMAVDIKAGESFQAGVPHPLFQARVQPITNVRNHYLPTGDGQRFLLLAPVGRESLVPTTVVLNWNAELGS